MGQGNNIAGELLKVLPFAFKTKALVIYIWEWLQVHLVKQGKRKQAILHQINTHSFKQPPNYKKVKQGPIHTAAEYARQFISVPYPWVT